ncbi:MAG: sigma-70 family RNA polymerase sigma factor [Phycisphaerae bacterium]|nr:sigma-70 family RNA polymerase sigma factor [Phycisphaerae bacterium]
MARTDEVLLSAYQDGESGAFDELVRRYAGSLLGFLTRMCRDSQQAEDLFQETFKKVYEKSHTFKGKGRFKSWLFTIANNLALDHIRKAGRGPNVISLEIAGGCKSEGCCKTTAPLPLEDSSLPSPADTLLLTEQKARVRAALAKLPVNQRTTLVMAYYQGMSYKEVAEVKNCSLGTVKSQMYRALKTLSTLLPEMMGGLE